MNIWFLGICLIIMIPRSAVHSFLCFVKMVCFRKYSLKRLLLSSIILISFSSNDPPLALANAIAEKSTFRISRPLKMSLKSSLTHSTIISLFLNCLASITLRKRLKTRLCCFSLVSVKWTARLTRDWTAISKALMGLVVRKRVPS